MSQNDARFAALSAHWVQSWSAQPALMVTLGAAGAVVAFQRCGVVLGGWPAHRSMASAPQPARQGPPGAQPPARRGAAVRRRPAVMAAPLPVLEPELATLALLRRAHAAATRVLSAGDDMLACLRRRAN